MSERTSDLKKSNFNHCVKIGILTSLFRFEHQKHENPLAKRTSPVLPIVTPGPHVQSDLVQILRYVPIIDFVIILVFHHQVGKMLRLFRHLECDWRHTQVFYLDHRCLLPPPCLYVLGGGWWICPARRRRSSGSRHSSTLLAQEKTVKRNKRFQGDKWLLLKELEVLAHERWLWNELEKPKWKMGLFTKGTLIWLIGKKWPSGLRARNL